MAKIHKTQTGNWLVDRKLNKLTGPLQKKAIRKASRKPLKPLQQEAKSDAKKHKVTGNYFRGIKVRSMKRSRSRTGTRVTVAGDGAIKQELGFTDRGGKKNDGIQALKRATKRKRRQVKRAYFAELKSVIRELSR